MVHQAKHSSKKQEPKVSLGTYAGSGERPDRDRCRSMLMSLGEMIPTNRPFSTTKVRPSLQPWETSIRLVTGSAGLTVETLSSGQATSLMRVVARASGATFLRAARVNSPVNAPLSSCVGKVECREVRMYP